MTKMTLHHPSDYVNGQYFIETRAGKLKKNFIFNCKFYVYVRQKEITKKIFFSIGLSA